MLSKEPKSEGLVWDGDVGCSESTKVVTHKILAFFYFSSGQY